MIAFCPEHPKWDQNPKFTLLSETTSIPTPFIWGVPPPPKKKCFNFAVKSLIWRSWLVMIIFRSFFEGTLISLARCTRIIEFFAGLQIVTGFCTLCSPFFLHFGHYFGEGKALISIIRASTLVFLENYYFGRIPCHLKNILRSRLRGLKEE